MEKMTPTLPPDALRETADPTGMPIQPGSRVRSFDFPLGYRSGAEFIGTDLEGPLASYIEGTVIGIGEMREGCRRYRILADRRIVGGEAIKLSDDEAERLFLPPVNGTPCAMGGRMSSVFVIDTP